MEKHNAFINLAIAMAGQSKCNNEQVGAIIIKDERILSSGYNTVANSMYDCVKMGLCVEDENVINSCPMIKAELSALINSREPMDDSTLYIMSLNPETGRVNTNYVLTPEILNIIYHVNIKSIVYIKDGVIVEEFLKDIYDAKFAKSAVRIDLLWNLINQQKLDIMPKMVDGKAYIMHSIYLILEGFKKSNDINLTDNEYKYLDFLFDNIDTHRFMTYLRSSMEEHGYVPASINNFQFIQYMLHDRIYGYDEAMENTVKEEIDKMFRVQEVVIGD